MKLSVRYRQTYNQVFLLIENLNKLLKATVGEALVATVIKVLYMQDLRF